MVQQAFNEVLVEVGKLVAMVLVNLAQDALGTVLIQLRQRVELNKLTQREWQVLGLIYSGYSNEQIAGELAVAATTIKTHIRNLYQKLGVAHRQDAVQHAQQLLKMMGYGV